MREQELRKIVEEIVKVLADKGYLKEGSCGCDSPKGSGSMTTIGTAGKVFSDDWQRPKSKIAPKPSEGGH